MVIRTSLSLKVINVGNENYYYADPALPFERKLPILYKNDAPAAVKDIKASALLWAARRFESVNSRALIINGIIAALDYGLICISTTNDGPDGEWKKVTRPERVDADLFKLIVDSINKNIQKAALNIIIAAKSNWYLKNYHVGKRNLIGQVKYPLQKHFENYSNELIAVVQILALSCSTRYVFRLVGMKGILPVRHLYPLKVKKLYLLPNALIQFQLLPVTTERLVVAYECAKRLVKTQYVKYCPNAMDFLAIVKLRDEILNNRAFYHYSAFYLTGRQRTKYNDMENEKYLGRLGAFITARCKLVPSLTRLPYFTHEKYKTYEDHNILFDNILTIYNLKLDSMNDEFDPSLIVFRTITDEMCTDLAIAFNKRTINQLILPIISRYCVTTRPFENE